ncbi:MAG: SemiSWEET transporter [Chthoniobacterales bacterium]|nr:SemiSWEET transporter [Chthoniobacterales bacterium]
MVEALPPASQWITVLGLLAGVLTTLSFLPQVLKAWKSRSTRDISLGMFLMFCTGVFLWIVYGVLVADIPVIAANVLTFLLAATILILKLRYH